MDLSRGSLRTVLDTVALLFAGVACGAPPVTVSFNAVDCGYAYGGESATWPPLSPIAATPGAGYSLSFATKHPTTAMYTLSSGMCRFDTSSLPDRAAISSATLKLAITEAIFNFDLRTLLIEYYNAWPIDGADYSALPIDGAYAIPITGLHSGLNPLALIAPTTNINKTGFTGFRISSGGGTVPTGQNNLKINQLGTVLEVTYTNHRTIFMTSE